jgi:hypothetical protein
LFALSVFINHFFLILFFTEKKVEKYFEVLKIFETNNMGSVCDGLYKSMKQNAGNFIYIVKCVDKVW